MHSNRYILITHYERLEFLTSIFFPSTYLVLVDLLDLRFDQVL